MLGKSNNRGRLNVTLNSHLSDTLKANLLTTRVDVAGNLFQLAAQPFKVSGNRQPKGLTRRNGEFSAHGPQIRTVTPVLADCVAASAKTKAFTPSSSVTGNG